MHEKRLHVDHPKLPLRSRRVDPSKLSRYMHTNRRASADRDEPGEPAGSRLLLIVRIARGQDMRRVRFAWCTTHDYCINAQGLRQVSGVRRRHAAA